MDLDALKDILNLVREHDLAEFEMEHNGLKVRIRKAGRDYVVAAAAPVPAQAPVAAPALTPVAPPPVASVPVDEGVPLAVIKAPIVGTLYRAAEPGAKPFVEVGSRVKKGQVLCIIEAMKLMNEIESECDGEITAAYVDNGQPVQFGDRIFAVKVD
ncbi:MAG TPA: acetyl-CoA carboxylase biotin carboxyl carrier protein [Vicinamibacterales bacterium]|nr:acetyl-CoA carboxylase biotin carboxyl carrier protein [Vicinamibacterales bacterium]